jgi:hypothetical protein
MTILIAYDGSGSTGGTGNRHYHDKTQQILAQYPDAEILFWENTGRIITRAEMADINAACRGGGGTDSSSIAIYCRAANFHGELIIITDGEVPAFSVDRCAEILGNDWKFEHVTAFLINTGGTVNMSVTCPFTRVSPHQICVLDRMAAPVPEASVIVTAADMAVIDELDAIGTIADYLAIADRLESLVIARTMGTTGDPTLRDRLLAMKKRITAAQARELGSSDTVRALHEALDAGNTVSAMEAARAITEEYYGGDDPKSWSGRISRLVSMCEGALRGAFDLSSVDAAIKGDRVRRAAAVAPTTIPTPAPSPAADAAAVFECPITLNEEHDLALLVTAGEPILADLDLGTTNDILDCPLNIFHYPEVVERLLARLDHPISLASYKEAHDAGAPFLTSPMTRAPLLAGAICIGNTEEHCRATHWTLAQLTTGGKLVGNPDLWFAVIWLALFRAPAHYLKAIEPQIAHHMRWRMKTHTSSISLTGAPEFPTTRVRLDAAIWYVFASATFSMDPRRDVLRAHLPHLQELDDMLRCLLPEFKLPNEKELRAHILHVRAGLNMLSWVKRPGQQARLANIIRGLYQATVRCGDDFIPVDGPPTAEQVAAARAALPAWYCDLPAARLYDLARKVDPGKSAGDIYITYGAPISAAPEAIVEWDYGVGPAPPAEPELQISPATCRPFYKVGAATWREAATAQYHIDSRRMISMNELYGNYVVKYGAYPTAQQLLDYIYRRKVVNGTNKTLPRHMDAFTAGTLADYATLTATLSPVEFARRFLESRPIERRQEIENY